MPTTYHYWAHAADSRRGPGYLRRWIAGETIGARLTRAGAEDVPAVLRVMLAPSHWIPPTATSDRITPNPKADPFQFTAGKVRPMK